MEEPWGLATLISLFDAQGARPGGAVGEHEAALINDLKVILKHWRPHSHPAARTGPRASKEFLALGELVASLLDPKSPIAAEDGDIKLSKLHAAVAAVWGLARGDAATSRAIDYYWRAIQLSSNVSPSDAARYLTELERLIDKLTETDRAVHELERLADSYATVLFDDDAALRVRSTILERDPTRLDELYTAFRSGVGDTEGLGKLLVQHANDAPAHLRDPLLELRADFLASEGAYEEAANLYKNLLTRRWTHPMALERGRGNEIEVSTRVTGGIQASDDDAPWSTEELEQEMAALNATEMEMTEPALATSTGATALYAYGGAPTEYAFRTVTLPPSPPEALVAFTFEEPPSPPSEMPPPPPSEVPLPPPSDPRPRDREFLVTASRLRSNDPIENFAPDSTYRLFFSVGPAVPFNLVKGEVAVGPIEASGRRTSWVISSEHITFGRISRGRVRFEQGRSDAEFELLLPAVGPSEIAELEIRTPEANVPWTLSIIISAGTDVYRTLNVDLSRGAQPKNDRICADPRHLDLVAPYEWATPPVEVTIVVQDGGNAYLTSRGGVRDYTGPYRWRAKRANLLGPITEVQARLESFRRMHSDYLDALDPALLERELAGSDWKPYDPASLLAGPRNGDSIATRALSSGEFRELAVAGFTLFEEVFPRESPLRTVIDQLPPGTRINVHWTEDQGDWISHVPWALMFVQPPHPNQAIDSSMFFAFRFRIESKSFSALNPVLGPSRALGTLDTTSALHLLFWGAEDEIKRESDWQRQAFSRWKNQHFIPRGLQKQKLEAISVLDEPAPAPAGLLYLFCQYEANGGQQPELHFGPMPDGVLMSADLSSSTLKDAPIVFANACMTAAGHPLGTSELERSFFRRGVRSFIGTETKVPVGLASRFAWLFFQFFYRIVTPKPLTAGEALTQARWFLYTRFSNVGGLFYSQANGYDLMFAANEEVESMRRS